MYVKESECEDVDSILTVHDNSWWCALAKTVVNI